MYEKEILQKMNDSRQLWKLGQKESELEHDMLYIGIIYEAASIVIPYSYAIIDLGCYMAAQAFLFDRHRQYIGVDEYDDPRTVIPGYTPPERFILDNSEEVRESIEDFVREWEKTAGDKEKTFAVMNAVPDPRGKLKKTLLSVFPDMVIKYPGEKGMGQGKYAEEVLHLDSILEQAECPYTEEYLSKNPEEAEKYRELKEKAVMEIRTMNNREERSN